MEQKPNLEAVMAGEAKVSLDLMLRMLAQMYSAADQANRMLNGAVGGDGKPTAYYLTNVRLVAANFLQAVQRLPDDRAIIELTTHLVNYMDARRQLAEQIGKLPKREPC